MSFSALCWAIVSMMQICMLSQFGQKQLRYPWLTSKLINNLLIVLTILFLCISIGINCQFEGISVGVLTWLFVILAMAFFIQIFFLYLLKPYFLVLYIVAILLGVLLAGHELFVLIH